MSASIESLFQYRPIFSLYLIISANFLANTFGCTIQRLLTNNMIAKHIMGFLTLYFFVVLSGPAPTDDEKKNDPYLFFKKFFVSLVLYGLFIASTRTQGVFFYLFLSLLALNFIISAYLDTVETDSSPALQTLTTWLGRGAMIVVVVGMVQYYLQQKATFKSQFKLSKFIFGTPVCRSLKK